MVFPNAGLLPVLEYLAMERGIAWNAGAFDRNIAQLEVTRPELLPAGLPQFLTEHARGRIRVGVGVDLPLLLANISLAAPEAKIIVLASHANELDSLVEGWNHASGKGPFSLSTREGGAGVRVATFLNGENVADDVQFHEYDLAIVLNAEDVCHEVAQRALSEQGARFKLLGIERASTRPAPRESDLMLAALGPAVFEIPTEGVGAAQVQTAFVTIRPPRIPPHLQQTELHRAGYWRHHQRNRRIGRLAEGLANGDAEIIHSQPDIAGWWTATGCRPLQTVLIAANLQHAIALLQQLPPTARLATSAGDSEIASLPKGQRQLINARRAHQWGHLLVSEGRFRWSARHTDCVVNAAGGPGIPEGPTFLSSDTPRRRVLIVDFNDRHQHQLQRWSQQRRQRYADRGWYRVGVDELTGRIQAFLQTRRELSTLNRNTQTPNTRTGRHPR